MQLNPRLAALVVAVAAGVGGVVYFAPKLAATQAELADAGICDECNCRRIACSLSFDDGGYAQRQFNIAMGCPDGGRILPRKLARAADDFGLHDIAQQCRIIGPASGGLENDGPDEAGDCGCVPYDGGNPVCRRADGGTWPTGWQNEMAPGEWSGGCVPKVCGEVFGRPNKPAGCRL